MAPSPSVFLAAVAQRSERLRFGPLLYVTPMYHPLRVAEEVVMLDHMSRGRLELGLGRGASPIEIASFDVDPANAPAMNREATEVILKALTSDIVEPRRQILSLQERAHRGAAAAAALSAAVVRADRAVARGRRRADEGQHRDADPERRRQGARRSLSRRLAGAGRQCRGHAACSASSAMSWWRTATPKRANSMRGAYRLWRHHMAFLWEWGGIPFPIGVVYPDDFEALEGMSMGIAGSAGNCAPLRRGHGRADRHQLFRRRHDLRFAALRSRIAFGRFVRQRGDARIPVTAVFAAAKQT